MGWICVSTSPACVANTIDSRYRVFLPFRIIPDDLDGISTKTKKPLLMDCLATDSMLYESREQLSRLMESRQQGKFTDINIEVEKKTFPCHKFVLDANCSYIKAFLSFSGNTDRIQTVYLLDFLYISKITITLNNALDLIQCSDFV